MLKIDNLTIAIDGKRVVKNFNLEIKAGEIEVVLGPNGAGKSTLLKTIMGFKGFDIVKGDIFFKGREIQKLSVDQRAKLGIGMIFQSPPGIKGVEFSLFLKKISDKKKWNQKYFQEVQKKLFKKELNVDFSGGEKKISELVQMQALEPELVLIDEVDSGLDVINLGKTARILRQDFLDQGRSILLVTHRGEIMQYLQPKRAHVMVDGEMICSEDWEKVWETIKKHGFKKCLQCSQFSM